jgi:hypothetical protein
MAKQKQQETEKVREEATELRVAETPEPVEEEREEEEEEVERLNHWQAAHRVVKDIDGDTCLRPVSSNGHARPFQPGAVSSAVPRKPCRSCDSRRSASTFSNRTANR